MHRLFKMKEELSMALYNTFNLLLQTSIGSGLHASVLDSCYNICQQIEKVEKICTPGNGKLRKNLLLALNFNLNKPHGHAQD